MQQRLLGITLLWYDNSVWIVTLMIWLMDQDSVFRPLCLAMLHTVHSCIITLNVHSRAVWTRLLGPRHWPMRGPGEARSQSEAKVMVVLMWAEWAANSLPFLSEKFQVSVAGGAGGNIEQGSSDFPITRLDQWWPLIIQFFHLIKLIYNFDTHFYGWMKTLLIIILKWL